MQTFKSERKQKSKDKFNKLPLSEGPIKIQDKVLLCKILDFTVHSRNYFFRKIKDNIFEDNVLGVKIQFSILKNKGKIYLNKDDFDLFKKIYSFEKQIHFNSLTFDDFSKLLCKARSTLYNNLNDNKLTLQDKILNKHQIKTYKIGDEYYISKTDAQSFIDFNSNIYLLSDFSGRLFGIDRQCLWKRIKKDNSSYYINFESPNGPYKLELHTSENKTFYITKEKYLELENFIYEKNKIMLNYLGLKEGVKYLGIIFKGNMYKKIINDEIRFLLKENLISIKLFKFNSNYYFEKKELEKLKSNMSDYKFYSIPSFISLLQSINYDKRFIAQISKIKSKDFDFNLNFEDINFTIHILCYKGKHYFSKTEIQKIYSFVKFYREKMENKSKLIDLAKKHNFTKKYLRKINFNDKIVSKTKNFRTITWDKRCILLQ